jgi:hypothetical protein
MLTDVMLDVAQAVHVALRSYGVRDPATLRRLVAPLGTAFLHIDHRLCERRVSVCGASAIFSVATRPAEPGFMPADGETEGSRFNGEVAVADWRVADGVKRKLGGWRIFSSSQWHVMTVDWLYRHLTEASRHLEDRLPPGLSAAEIAREVARQAAAALHQHADLLDVLLLDALGYPREVVALSCRLQLRGQYPSPGVGSWHEVLLSHTQDLRHWPGRSRKLLPVAVATAAMGIPFTPKAVRDALMDLGLSRNAWGRLMRWPVKALYALSRVMLASTDEAGLRCLLDEVSVWQSRLSSGLRLYGLPREHAVCILVWLPRECAALNSRPDVQRAPGVDDDGLLGDAYAWRERMISRVGMDASLHGRLQLMLMAFARKVAASPKTFDLDFAALEAAIDWFAAEAQSYPVGWYKQPFPVMVRHSLQWHLEQQEQRLAMERDRQQWRPEAPPVEGDLVPGVETTEPLSWTAPLERFERDGVVFEALLDSVALKQEGSLMGHCVGSYTNRCDKGYCLIYAVSRDGVRVGTLELQASWNNGWQPAQFKGPCNQELAGLIQRGGDMQLAFSYFRRALNAAMDRPKTANDVDTSASYSGGLG